MKNKNTALITGASQRIGKEMAIYLAKKGYDLVIHYNNSKEQALKLIAELKKNYNIDGATIDGDLSDKSSAKKIADFMFKNFPNWNLLINNSSIFHKSKFLNDLDEEFEKNLNIHLTSPLYLSHFFAKNVIEKKIKNAQIINMLDKNIARIDTVNFYYLLSKKFLAEFTKMLALEIAPHIRVNGIAPGYILPEIDVNPEYLKKLPQLIPLQKIGDTKNIVQTLEFLLENDFINGQILSIDGGASLNHVG
jgi:NAD(P)-dependent dehydrogenase (short-subunit alcohol dehydrogenase family)